MSTEIRRVDSDADLVGVGELISRSFDHLDANHYLVPDEGQRLRVMSGYFGLLARYAAQGAGQVHVTGDGTAAAVWFDRTGDGDLPEYESLLAEAAGEFLPQFQQLDEVFDANHPTEPHWHLAFLAVLPEHWGRGIGTALMNHTHRRLDTEGVAAYLEATNPQNVSLYRRHGYTDMDPFVIRVGDVPFYRMWRPAQPA